MSETQVQPGGNRIPEATRVAVDGTTIRGDGSQGNPLRAIGSAGAPYALAHVTNSEGPVLAAGQNVASVNYVSPFLRVVLTTPVPDASLAIPSATLESTSSPPNTITATMEDATTILIAMTDGTNTPVLLPCFVNLFLIPAP